MRSTGPFCYNRGDMTDKIKVKRDTTQFINQAWARNGKYGIITGEALILATLLHTHGAGRNSDDFKIVQSLMNDVNIEDE